MATPWFHSSDQIFCVSPSNLLFFFTLTKPMGFTLLTCPKSDHVSALLPATLVRAPSTSYLHHCITFHLDSLLPHFPSPSPPHTPARVILLNPHQIMFCLCSKPSNVSHSFQIKGAFLIKTHKAYVISSYSPLTHSLGSLVGPNVLNGYPPGTLLPHIVHGQVSHFLHIFTQRSHF